MTFGDFVLTALAFAIGAAIWDLIKGGVQFCVGVVIGVIAGLLEL